MIVLYSILNELFKDNKKNYYCLKYKKKKFEDE